MYSLFHSVHYLSEGKIMFSFKGCFFNNQVYINGKFQYDSNEILTAFLNTNMYDIIEEEEWIFQIKRLKNKLILSSDMDYEDYMNYNKNVKSATEILNEINKFFFKLPPFSKIKDAEFMTLDELLNDYSFFFEDGLGEDEEVTWETVNEFGYGEEDEQGRGVLHLYKFIPTNSEDIEKFDSKYLLDFNGELEYFFDSYITLLESYLAVHNIFVPFIDKFLHSKETFLSQKELVNAFNEFNKSQGQNLNKITCSMDSFCYKSLKDEQGNDILCEEINFTDLQSFLYFDLFYGIRHNYIPKKCLNCGRYFLIKSGKYFNYCENATKDEPSKSCRDVGARRRYGDKCKNDPIWQTYNRAYKAHYARYMKKKMTISQFEEWSRFASEFRDKAIANSISFEEYFREIRK